MSKIKFDKEETKNLLNMLKSGDSENHTIAFQALQNAELKDYKGELLVLYKYAKISSSTWEKESPKAHKALSKLTGNFENLTSGKCLSIMTSENASKDSIELFLENFVVDMVGFLEQLGYPADKFNINIELKE
jgi:TusA-related sulfurtransferase